MNEFVYLEDGFRPGVALRWDDTGRIVELSQQVEHVPPLNNHAVLPGLVNAHSHAFQRVIRGRTEYRTMNRTDNFWTWRQMMYEAANRLTPEDVYDVSRMAFLEMALSGITTVGEFHYLHHSPDGSSYDDPNLLSKQVVQAARDVGLRIALLRVAYARSGYKTASDPQQLRFLEKDTDEYLTRAAQLQSDLREFAGAAWLGLAPHSIRAVPLPYLKSVVRFAVEEKLPVHMHVAEQPAEITACLEEYARSPVELLHTEGLLSEMFTAVHAIHLSPAEISALAEARAKVCACPTTERNLGDGIVRADAFFKAGVGVCLGSDSQIQIDLLEDARELEYHLRLQKRRRAVLASAGDRSALARKLFECATSRGAESLGQENGSLKRGYPADFFTVNLNDPSLASVEAEDLIARIVFSCARSAIKDVVVGGKTIVADGRHRDQDEIVERFKALQRRLWG